MDFTVLSEPYIHPKQVELLEDESFLTVPFNRLSDLDIWKTASLHVIVVVHLLVGFMGKRTESFSMISEHKSTVQKSKISHA